MAEHARLVPPADEEAGEQLHSLLEVLPRQLAAREAGVDGLEELLVGQRVQRGQRHVEDGQRALEGRLGHELHVALQLVELRDGDGHHLVAGALDHQVAPLQQVQGQLEVQVGALAAGDQVAAQLAHCEWVGLAVEADVAHDVLAAVDAVLDVRVEVATDLLVVGKVIQGDLGEGQEAGDLLEEEEEQRRQRYMRVWWILFSGLSIFTASFFFLAAAGFPDALSRHNLRPTLEIHSTKKHCEKKHPSELPHQIKQLRLWEMFPVETKKPS